MHVYSQCLYVFFPAFSVCLLSSQHASPPQNTHRMATRPLKVHSPPSCMRQTLPQLLQHHTTTIMIITTTMMNIKTITMMIMTRKRAPLRVVVAPAPPPAAACRGVGGGVGVQPVGGMLGLWMRTIHTHGVKEEHMRCKDNRGLKRGSTARRVLVVHPNQAAAVYMPVVTLLVYIMMRNKKYTNKHSSWRKSRCPQWWSPHAGPLPPLRGPTGGSMRRWGTRRAMRRGARKRGEKREGRMGWPYCMHMRCRVYHRLDIVVMGLICILLRCMLRCLSFITECGTIPIKYNSLVMILADDIILGEGHRDACATCSCTPPASDHPTHQTTMNYIRNMCSSSSSHATEHLKHIQHARCWDRK